MIEELKCAKCKNFFNLGFKQPRLFVSCGHTFCEDCLVKILENKEEVICPIDNIQNPYVDKEKGVSGFPINFALRKIVKNNQSMIKKKKCEN